MDSHPQHILMQTSWIFYLIVSDVFFQVRWLEAQNKKLEAELEALRNRKQEDWKPIRDMFQGELDQARKVIAELSSEKGINEGKLANLQDEIQSLKELWVHCCMLWTLFVY